MTSASRSIPTAKDDRGQFPLDAAFIIVNQFNYGQLENLVLQHLDALDGIKTSFEGSLMVRDASVALPLDKRLAPSDPLILKENLLLRALSVVRGIDQVLRFQHAENPSELWEIGRAKLKILYQQLMATLMDADVSRANFKKIQKQFNSQLIQVLHEMQLDTGIDDSQGFKKLLGHYRNLAALLDPAKTMKTITQHTLGDVEITQTEISAPITQKTAEQKQQIDVMKKIIPRQPEIYNDFHSSKKVAFQLANQAFCELLKMDDRRLPAQSRLAIAPTLKNAYLVTNQCEFKRGDNITSMHCTTLRCASLVYVGGDDSKDKLKKYAHENLIQLQTAAAEKNLHITILLTNSMLNHQDLIIRTTTNALESINDNKMQAALQRKTIEIDSYIYYSYIPTNFQGSTEKAELAPIIGELKLKLPATAKPDFFNRYARLDFAAQVINLFSNVANFINVTMCASGQDRTGTATEAATQIWILNQYKNFGIDAVKETIEKQRALGCHNAVLASLAAPGSPGMKADSNIKTYFSALTDQYFYRDDANTNKLLPLDKPMVEECLKRWHDNKNQVYEHSIFKIEYARVPSDIQIALLEWLEMAIPACDEKNFTEIFSLFSSHQTPLEKTRLHLTNILSALKTGLTEDKPQGELLAHLKMNAGMLDVSASAASMSESLMTVFTQLKLILTLALMKSTAIHQQQTTPDPQLIRRHRA
jgi:hypothetical protein